MVSVCERLSPYAGSLRGMFGLSGFFCLTQMVGIPTDFYSQIFGGLLFLTQGPWAGESLCGALARGSFRETSAAAIPPGAQPPGAGAGPAHFISPPFSQISMWFFLYIVSCMCDMFF